MRETENGELAGRVLPATAWALGSVAGNSLLRLGSQIALTYLIAREYFGVIAVLRAALMALRQFSQVGIRGSLLYHERGGDPTFLNSAWTLQALRGLAVWLGACALAWPASVFYGANDERAFILLWLLPLAGLEAVFGGLQTTRLIVRERGLRLRLPVLLDGTSLVTSILVTLVWAWLAQPDPGVWPLVAGPLAGSIVKLAIGHLLLRDLSLRFQWDPGAIRELLGFGKWIFLGTIASFLAQQFHILYLGRVAPLAALGVYQVAWNFVLQCSKPLTVLSNRILIPLFAESGRLSAGRQPRSIRAGIDRFLPACLTTCVLAGGFCPALFGYLYSDDFAEGGRIGAWLTLVVWFMILQHAPRSALLSVGDSKGVFRMACVNASLTIAGCLGGYALGSRGGSPLGALEGLMLGNALGNAAGVLVGIRISRDLTGLLGGALARYTLAFLGLGGLGLLWMDRMTEQGWSERSASLALTLGLAVPLGILLWRKTLRVSLSARGQGSRSPTQEP